MSVVINLASNTSTFSTVDSLTSGGTDDTVVFTGALANASIDLGAGSDSVALGNSGNTATFNNVETVTGGTGNDVITLRSGLTTAMAVNLGGGADKLILANGGNTGTLSGVETLVGGTGADAITLGGAVTNGSIDLGAGATRSPWPTAPTAPPSVMWRPSPAAPGRTPSRSAPRPATPASIWVRATTR